MANAGTAALVPDEVSAFAAGKWQTVPSLAIRLKENDSEIKGMIHSAAPQGLCLAANCSQKRTI